MITKLQWWLGNQMFQYALTYLLEKKRSKKMYFDSSLFYNTFPLKWTTKRLYALDVFNIQVSEHWFSRLSKIRPFHFFLPILSIVFFPIILWKKYYKETANSFDTNVLNKKFNYYCWRFQSYKYFEWNEQNIKQLFTFSKLITENDSIKKLAHQIHEDKSVSLHIRRGDYVTSSSANAYHGVLWEKFYNDAIEIIKLKLWEDIIIYVFSDDIERCKNNLAHLHHTIFFVDDTYSWFKNAWHLYLMSQCKAHIIANSSFSRRWAYLNDTEQKVVIAPKQWTVQEFVKDDLILKHWIKI